jgi:hypothetical protein
MIIKMEINGGEAATEERENKRTKPSSSSYEKKKMSYDIDGNGILWKSTSLSVYDTEFFFFCFHFAWKLIIFVCQQHKK